MIREYNRALNGEAVYVLTTDCLNHHKQNIRLEDIIPMFYHVGIDNASAWIAAHPLLVNHFQSRKKILEQTESAITTLVQYRNDAAHGAVTVDEILGFDQLEEDIQFIRVFSMCLNQLVNIACVDHMITDGRAEDIGIFTKEYSGNIVLSNIEGATIAVGEKIMFKSSTSFEEHVIQSIQIEDESVAQVVVAKALEVGIGLSGKASPPAARGVENLRGRCRAGGVLSR